jgi:hypothetical protein
LYSSKTNIFNFCNPFLRDEESATRAKNAHPHELSFYGQTMLVSNVKFIKSNYTNQVHFSMSRLVAGQPQIKHRLKVKVE